MFFIISGHKRLGFPQHNLLILGAIARTRFDFRMFEPLSSIGCLAGLPSRKSQAWSRLLSFERSEYGAHLFGLRLSLDVSGNLRSF